MKARLETADQLRAAGMAALTKSLGRVNGLRFLQLFEKGAGDYTAERDQILGRATLKELASELRRLRRGPRKRNARTGRRASGRRLPRSRFVQVVIHRRRAALKTSMQRDALRSCRGKNHAAP